MRPSRLAEAANFEAAAGHPRLARLLHPLLSSQLPPVNAPSAEVHQGDVPPEVTTPRAGEWQRLPCAARRHKGHIMHAPLKPAQRGLEAP